jgi:hypothetical protein
MQSGYHNLPSFGGVDQKDGERYSATNKQFSEAERSLSSELKYAYPAEAGIESYVRRVALSGGVVTIDEAITLCEVKEIDFHLMLSARPSVISGNEISLPEGRTLYFDPSLTVEVEEFDPIGMETKNTWGSDKLYRLHFKIKTDKCNVTFTIK